MARAWQPTFVLLATMAFVAVMMRTMARGGNLADEAIEEVANVPVSAVSTQVNDVDMLFSNPYDWDGLHEVSEGRYMYVEDGETLSRLGVDVSEHQQDIDWQAVANDGIEFAIIRIGYRGATSGMVTEDATFDYNLHAARAAGLDVGVYFYSLATSTDEAREEADFVVSTLDGTGLDYPIVFDMEPTAESSERLRGLDKDTMTGIAQAFCERVESVGYHASIYGNQTDLSRYHLMKLAQYGFWYAQYDPVPTMNLRFALWQYTQQGEVGGIDTPVDLDLDLIAALGEQEEEGQPT